MKKLLLSILLLLSVFSVRSQSWVYHPFPTDSAVWTTNRGTYNVISCCPPVVDYYPEPPDRYCLPGTDTVIGSLTYKKMYRCGAAYKGALRDDIVTRKVYFIPADSTSELLMYDFSVVAGDTAHIYEQYPDGVNYHPMAYAYISTDSILINGNYRKRIKFGNADGEWVEGIGCTKGLFREGWPNVSNWYNTLECMSDGDLTLYPSTSMGPCSLFSGVNESAEELKTFEIFPNPATDILHIRSEKEITRVQMFDLLGKQIYSKEIKGKSAEIDLAEKPAGIYFVRISGLKGDLVTKKIVKE